MCEFNSHYITYLFKWQRPQIRAYLAVADVFHQCLPNFSPKREASFIPVHIAEYLEAPLPDAFIKRLTALIRKTLFFVQKFDFAPEISSIINRSQFNSWARSVKLHLLRPFDQPTHVLGLVFGENWPYSAYLLRAYPVIALDPPFTRLISQTRRIPYFLEVEDLYPTLNPLTVRFSRRLNRDIWNNRDQESEYLGYDIALDFPWFPEDEIEQEFSEAEELSEDESL